MHSDDYDRHVEMGELPSPTQSFARPFNPLASNAVVRPIKRRRGPSRLLTLGVVCAAVFGGYIAITHYLGMS